VFTGGRLGRFCEGEGVRPKTKESELDIEVSWFEYFVFLNCGFEVPRVYFGSIIVDICFELF